MTGWKEDILGQLSGRWTALFFIFWICGFFVTFKPHASVWVSGAFIVCAICACVCWRRHFTWPGLIQIACSSLLIGASDVLVRQLERMEPAFGVWNPLMDRSTLLAILVLLVVRGLPAQFVVMTVSLALSEWLYAKVINVEIPIVLGDAGFFDQWMLVLVLVRVTLFVAASLAAAWKRIAQ